MATNTFNQTGERLHRRGLKPRSAQRQDRNQDESGNQDQQRQRQDGSEEGENRNGGQEADRRGEKDIEDGRLIGLGDEVEGAREFNRLEERHIAYANKIREAYTKGDKARFDMLGTQYQKFCHREQVMEREVNILDIKIGNFDAASQTQPEQGTAMPTIASTGSLTPLSKYLDDAIKSCNQYFPISVFTPEWLKLDAIYDYDTMPSEWRQDFARWSQSYDLYVRYVKELLDFPEFVDGLIRHKEVVLEIKEECMGCWTPAFRYDMTQRRNVLHFRLPDGSMADVGTRNDEYVKIAIRESEFMKDDYYDDNPYIVGGDLEHINPYTGEDHTHKSPWDATTSDEEDQVQAFTGRRRSHLAQSGSSRQTWNSRDSNQAAHRYKPYQGRNNLPARPHFNSNQNYNPYYGNHNVSWRQNRGRRSRFNHTGHFSGHASGWSEWN